MTMITDSNTRPEKEVYYRLIALWAVVEAFLGGMIHGLKLPVSGLIIGSGAVLCICLIGWYYPVKGAILKATILVAVCKMMLSPHSPPPAYIAVFFQGLLGEILFFNKKYFRASCILLGTIALLESAIQRVLVMTIIYGKNIWVVINEFMNNLTHQKNITNYSIIIVAAYLLLHAAAGITAGYFAGSIVGRSKTWRLLHKDLLIILPALPIASGSLSATAPKHKKLKTGLFITWLVLVGLLLYSFIQPEAELLPKQVIVQILFRSVLIMLTWYFLVSPVLQSLLKKWLQKQLQKSKTDIERVLLLLPATQYIMTESWRMSKPHKGIRRTLQCTKIILINILQKSHD